MNRREFLLSLLSVPFGWKALFGKREKKDKWVQCAEPGWYIVGEASTHDEQISDEFTSGYPNVSWEFPPCEVKPEIHRGQCEVLDLYIPGQWSYYNDLCQWLAEIIERDVPGMLLEGAADIEIYNRHVYIRYPCGPHFWCPDIEEDKTVWYKRVEKSSPYGDLFYSYEWELIA